MTEPMDCPQRPMSILRSLADRELWKLLLIFIHVLLVLLVMIPGAAIYIYDFTHEYLLLNGFVSVLIAIGFVGYFGELFAMSRVGISAVRWHIFSFSTFLFLIAWCLLIHKAVFAQGSSLQLVIGGSAAGMSEDVVVLSMSRSVFIGCSIAISLVASLLLDVWWWLSREKRQGGGSDAAC